MTSIIEIEEIETTEGLEQIKDEWDLLLGSCAGATPFQHPEWLIAWWRHLGQGRLIALAMRAAGRLCGVAPFYMKDGEVRFLGSGISDYLGLILERSVELIATEAVLRHLAARGDWRSCRLEELRPSSALLLMKPPERPKIECLQGEVCLRARLPGTVEAFRMILGRSEKRITKEISSKFFDRGLVFAAAEREDDIRDYLDTIFALHAKRWKSVGKSGVLHGPNVRAFHDETTRAFMNKGMLRLYNLSLGGRSIAALYGFVSRSTFYAYVSGYDPDFAKVSPGKLMLISAAEDCIEKGVDHLDFLRGAEKYKYRWNPEETRNSTLVITR